MFRCGRRAHRRSRAVHEHQPTSRPSYRSKAAAAASASTFPPCPLTKTSRDAHCDADRPNSTSKSRSADVPIDTVPGKPSCSPLAPYPIAGARTQLDSFRSASRSATERATAVAMRVSVSSGRWGPCCSTEPTGMINAGDVLCSCLDVEFAELAGESHPPMVGRIHLACANCWRMRSN